MSALLFGVVPTDFASYAVGGSLLVGAALLAGSLPVRRVVRAGAARALRG